MNRLTVDNLPEALGSTAAIGKPISSSHTTFIQGISFDQNSFGFNKAE